jgi:hypothetical protein
MASPFSIGGGNMPREARHDEQTLLPATPSAGRKPLADLQLEAKAKQASKLAEIREVLIAAGYHTTAEQAFALGVNRSTAWALLNRDKRAGPSSVVLKRILSSPNLPPAARLKAVEYINEKIGGGYGHHKDTVREFGKQFRPPT